MSDTVRCLLCSATYPHEHARESATIYAARHLAAQDAEVIVLDDYRRQHRYQPQPDTV